MTTLDVDDLRRRAMVWATGSKAEPAVRPDEIVALCDAYKDLVKTMEHILLGPADDDA